MVADVRPGGLSSNAADLTIYNGKLYFGANDGIHGRELWAYDPATATHSMVADINPDKTFDSGSSRLGYLTVYDGKLYFSANDGPHGSELWAYDSATDTPSMAADIITSASPRGATGTYLRTPDYVSQALSSYPSHLTVLTVPPTPPAPTSPSPSAPPLPPPSAPPLPPGPPPSPSTPPYVCQCDRYFNGASPENSAGQNTCVKPVGTMRHCYPARPFSLSDSNACPSDMALCESSSTCTDLRSSRRCARKAARGRCNRRGVRLRKCRWTCGCHSS